MLIRPAADRDFEPIATLTNFFIRETVIHFGTIETTASELRDGWLQTRDRYPFLICEMDGKFAGFCKASVWRSREAYQWTPECGVYVEQWARQRGVGKALYAQLFEVLRGQGFHSLVAGITLPNEASVRLHESMGFIASGIIRNAGWKCGRWNDVGFWQRTLQPENQPPKPLCPVPT